MNTETFKPHASIEKELSSTKERLDQLQAYRKNLNDLGQFGSALLVRAPAGVRPIWTEYLSSVRLVMFFSVSGFTSEASPELAEFLEYISEYYSRFPTSIDNPTDNVRTYSFVPEKPEGLHIQLIAELLDDSEACHRIVTGMRRITKYMPVVVDEPVYSFKC